MLSRFPKSYQCDKEIVEWYPEIEKIVMPIMKKKSYKISRFLPSVDFDDAIQEGRIALLSALMNYDENKNNGAIEPYVNRVVINAYHTMVYNALTKAKVPYMEYIDKDGIKYKRPYFPISLEGFLVGNQKNIYGDKYIDGSITINTNKESILKDGDMLQDEKLCVENIKEDVRRFTMKMYNKLDGIDLDVFRCMVHPSSELLEEMYLQGENFIYRNVDGELLLEDGFKVANKYIMKYLNISKNQIDWSLGKIRTLFMKIAKFDKDFDGLFDNTINSNIFPKIHVSHESYDDIEFKRDVFKKRNLDVKQTKQMSCKHSINYSMMVKYYDWGATISLRKKDQYVTFVVEGRFNVNSGFVLGKVGAKTKLPVSWYDDMLREFKNGI